MPSTMKPGQAGDRIEVCSPARDRCRPGVIAEVLGRPGHEHYRVRWNDGRESVHYPSDGTRILRRPTGAGDIGGPPGEPDAGGLTDAALHSLLPTAVDDDALPPGAGHDIPFGEPVRVYGDRFRG